MTDQPMTDPSSDENDYPGEDQLQPEDTLTGGGDPLDEGITPPDSQPRATEYGTTAAEQVQGESFEQRINQEVADPDSAYGAPDDEGGLEPEARVGGDDPDSIPADADWSGDAEVGDGEAGVLVSDDEGAREDTDAELDATDEGGRGDSPEEQAVHVVDD